MLRIGCFGNLKDNEGAFADDFALTAYAAQLRFDFMDFHRGQSKQLEDRDYVTRLKYLVLKKGLYVSHIHVGGGFFGAGDKTAKKVESCKAGIDIASLLGAPVAAVYVGAPDESDPDPDASWHRVGEHLRALADYAATKAVSLGIHNHNEGTGRPRGKDIVRAIKLAGRENVTAVMDTGQWWPNSNTGAGDFTPNEHAYEYMEEVAPYASVLFAKIYRIDSGREELVDYERVFRILEAVKFNGGVSVAYKKTYTEIPYREGLPIALAHLRETAAKVGL